MPNIEHSDFIIGSDDPILITGANGFIGSRVVENLVDRGFRELLCLTRPSNDSAKLEALVGRRGIEARIRVVKGIFFLARIAPLGPRKLRRFFTWPRAEVTSPFSRRS